MNDRDSDSLAFEGGKLPETVAVITGRFERNPPLFYQMRLRRVAREITAHPNSWNLYDDAAVACDRLHDEDAALDWIERKHAGLKRACVTEATPEGKEAWYRYHANAGTFQAHRFLQHGAKPEQIGEMQAAIRHIETALVLKPNAHFGRERYQLAAMRWIAGKRGGPPDPAHPEGLRDLLEAVPRDGDIRRTEAERAVEGLSGLIVLGNAWESVDIFAALARSLSTQGEGKVAYIALLRCEELLRTGHPSFAGTATGDWAQSARQLAGFRRGVTNEDLLRVKFVQLRQAADHWQAERDAYLVARLNIGQHPDTTPGFWKDFHAAPPPTLDIPWREEAPDNFRNWQKRQAAPFLMLVFVVATGSVLVLSIVRRVRRVKRQRAG